MMRRAWLLIVFLVCLAAVSLAEPDCPRGRIDCRGECGMMVDADGDGFCDHSALSQPKQMAGYQLFEICGSILLLYILSLILSKKGCYTQAVHRRIWNYLLLATFLVSAVLGLLLVVLINWRIDTDLYRTYLLLHVDFGIAMAMVGIFHFVWHWNYYFRRSKKI